jgi:hypothetical protein
MVWGIASAVSLETVSINGSNYYWAGVNDSNGNPWVLINASSGNSQFSTTETENITDALARQDWLHYDVLFGGLSIGNSVTSLTTATISSFNTYSYTDNATYWRTEANTSTTLPGRSRLNLRLQHSRGEGDHYVNITMRYEMTDTSFTSLSDVYFFLKISNITRFDTVNIAYNLGGGNYSARNYPINGSYNFTGASAVILFGNQSPPSWEYRFDSEKNVVVVKNGTIWLGYNLGKTVAGALSTTSGFSFQRSFFAIDLDPCVISCDPDTVVTVQHSITNNTNSQVAVNKTARARWNDLSTEDGVCIISKCMIGVFAYDLYGTTTTKYRIANNASGGPKASSYNGAMWLTCDSSTTSGACNASNKAELDVLTASKANPVKNTYYSFGLTEKGRYNYTTSLPFDPHHSIACLVPIGLNDADSSTDKCSAGDIYTGSDAIAPTVSCTLNGAAIANNSVNTITTTDLIVNCTFDGGSTQYGGTGLVNVSKISLNISSWGGAENVSNLIDDYSGTQGISYPVTTNTAYLLCAGVNGTARSSGTGADTNWTTQCYVLTSINLVTAAPQFTSFSYLNYSSQGFLVNFSGVVTDATALSSCIYSFNITGSFVNETQVTISGTTASCLQNKSFAFPGSYGVRLWVNNSANVFNMTQATVLITPSGPQLNDYAIPLGIAIAGGALGYWVYRRSRR